MKYHNLVEAIQHVSTSSSKGITFIKSGKDEAFVSYNQLYQKARDILSGFQSAGMVKSDELVFQVIDNQLFIEVYWACLLGGIIPVPVSVGNNDEHRLKVFNIWKVLNSPWIFAAETSLNKLQKFSYDNELEDDFNQMKARHIDESLNDLKTDVQPLISEPSGDDIAFIQFSSGSTGDPKGVTLTHRNLLANIDGILGGIDSPGKGDTFFSWMPLTHDMGLIGFHLTPLVAGWDHYIMPTELFIRRPVLWLEKISEHRATFTSSPNFGYSYVLKHFDTERHSYIDLSCLRIIVNGAEPISAELCQEFTERMAPYGLRQNVIFPVYGLAEASLAVSFSSTKSEVIPVYVDRSAVTPGTQISVYTAHHEDALTFVNVGRSIKHCSFKIVDSTGNVLRDLVAGHIYIKGDNVTRGYYNNPDATTATIDKDGWLNTGDLGFTLAGDLIITGRAKDIIFVNGQNFYPHDIERVAEEIDGLELGKIVVFGHFNSKTAKEEIVAFISHKGKVTDFAEVATQLKKLLNEKFQIELTAIIPVNRIPKTTSGKVQRFKLGNEYLNGAYDNIVDEVNSEIEQLAENACKHTDGPLSHNEELIVRICRQSLGIKYVNSGDNLLALGMNSLTAASLATQLSNELDIEIPISLLFEHSNVKELAAALKEQKVKTTHSSPVKRKVQKQFGVSSVQRRLYYADQLLEGQSIAYNVPYVVNIEGSIDVEKLSHVFKNLLKRHAQLRSGFVLDSDEIRQYISEDVDFDLHYDHIEHERLEDTINDFLRPFSTESASLFRAALFQTRHDHYSLVMDCHHLVADGTTLTILFRELWAAYDGERLQENAFTYQDFISWEHDYVQSDDYKNQEKFWESELAAGMPVLELPTDYTRPAFIGNQGRRLPFNITDKLNEKIRTLAISKQVTPFTIFMAAYNILLSRFSAQEEIVVGVPVHGRKCIEFKEVAGVFVNTIPLLTRFVATETFSNYIKDLKARLLTVFAHQDYLYEHMVQKSGVTPSGRNPLFDTMFTYQNMQLEYDMPNGLSMHKQRFDPGISKFDLSLEVEERKSGFDGWFEYKTELFRHEAIERLSEHYLNILETIVDTPDVKLKDIKILTAKETNFLVEDVNFLSGHDKQLPSVLELFDQQVALHPEALAISGNGVDITYQELKRKANTISRMLSFKGIGPGDIVGIIADDYYETVACMLGIMTSGAAFLPVDAAYPNNRIGYILENSQASGVILGSTLAEKYSTLLSGLKTQVFDLSRRQEVAGDVAPSPHVLTDELAYVIYTSGTTGKPKGIKIGHQSFSNYVQWASTSYIQGEQLGFALYTSISFDLTITSIFTPLITGNTIFCYNPEHYNENILDAIIKDNKAGIIKATPSHLKLVRDKVYRSSSVRRFVVGGEDLEASLAHDVTKVFNHTVEIYNEYGPTEATVGCMIYKFNTDTDLHSSVPIGKPAAGTAIYLLDKYLNLVPVGVAGEMYISGKGLAKGYLNNDDLTADKFLTDPFKGQKMYRTGDMAKRMPDGNIIFLGRVDNQVKIRGHRIELDEITRQLGKHEAIKDVTTTVVFDNAGDKQLCAYYISNKSLNYTVLRDFMSSILPSYMVPSYFVHVDNIPLTRNGKPDHNALPVPTVNTQRTIDEPDTTEGKMIAGIWSEVLGVEKVGANDNFYELGGDSIKAVQIASKLQSRGLTLKPRDILLNNTIYGLCANVTLKRETELYAQGIAEGNRKLTPIENWFFAQQFAVPGHYNQSVLLDFKQTVNIECLERSFDQMILHFDGLRSNYNPESKTIRYNNELLASPFKIETIDDLTHFTSEEQKTEIDKAGLKLKSTFDITRDLLLRAAYFELSDNNHKLLITAHHLVVDGISWRLMLEHLAMAYRTITRGQEVKFEPKTAPLERWVEALDKRARQIAFGKDRIEWQQLNQATMPLQAEYQTQDWILKNSDNIHLVSDTIDAKALQLGAHQIYNTDLQTVLIAALCHVVSKWSENNHIVMELESHGRILDETDVSRTIGWFTAIYPVAFQLQYGNMPNLVKQVKETLKQLPGKLQDAGLLKYPDSPDGDKQLPALRFNYLGRFDHEVDNELFTIDNTTSTGADISPDNTMTAQLDINCMIINDKFVFDLAYNRLSQSKAAMQALTDDYVQTLERLAHEMEANDEVQFTPSDFETIDLDQNELESLFD